MGPSYHSQRSFKIGDVYRNGLGSYLYKRIEHNKWQVYIKYKSDGDKYTKGWGLENDKFVNNGVNKGTLYKAPQHEFPLLIILGKIHE